MCGLTGFWTRDAGVDLTSAARAMNDALCHRGPDDEGYFLDPDAGVGLAHRRLSILDLSPEGHQPMASPSARYVTVFNGEIYNFRELGARLERGGARFRGHSDTEVMLAAIERWGIRATVEQLVGMFAIALWDRKERTLTLVRDRLGEKPLYYGWLGGSFVFASELKSLTKHPAWRGDINRDAITAFLRHNYIPAPLSIYRGISKLLPGCIATLRDDEVGAQPTVQPYWSAAAVAAEGLRHPAARSDAQAVEELEHVLGRAVAQEMVADVPLGAFLSGGIDSTAIVALMQQASTRPVRTFTIGFEDRAYNEADHARAVASHLGTEHTELVISPAEAREVIPLLPSVYDEPFADSSQIPTYLVSRLARAHVTVSLSGDGGDELFGGYNRYTLTQRLWGTIGWMPTRVRRGVAGAMGLVPAASVNGVVGALPKRWRVPQPADKWDKVRGLLAYSEPQALYRDLVSHWKSPEEIVVDGREPLTPLAEAAPARSALIPRMMYLDAVSYLPDDILVKVDRAAMAVSLESRAPFLDHRVFEFAWSVPMRQKIRNGVGKWLLRQLVYKHVPASIMDRPKMGFGVPIGDWLRGPLRSWADDLLAPDRLRREGFFRPEAIHTKWLEHRSGARNWQYLLWDVLMFEAWLAAR